MNHINRNRFLRQSLQVGAVAFFCPVGQLFATGTAAVNTPAFLKEDIFERLVKANDGQVKRLLSLTGPASFSRRVGFDFATLVASYCTKESSYYQQSELVLALNRITDQLLSVQSADGTVSIGNLESPPDTAFLLEPLCSAAQILMEHPSEPMQPITEKIKRFIVKAAAALASGGVHTPNHRWVISAALAQINHLYPNQQYVARIADWLGEGVFIDADGHYPERSMTYSYVENRSLLTMGRLLNKPALFAPVKKNLEMTYYYMEPDGSLVTTDSRRQDQYLTKNIVSWYLLYRYFAIRDNNRQFAAIAKSIEQMEGFNEEILDTSLFHFLETPLLQKEMPAPIQLSVEYEKLFTTSHLARIRRGNTSATIFGGVDWPLIIASGRSDSPNFFSYRKGKAALKYLRLSSDFFSMGYFYSEGLKKKGNSFILHKKQTVPYYQPLPKNLRNAKGDYQLSPSTDGRFWNKMAFEKRPVSNVKTLETTITVTDADDRTSLHFLITGMPGVAVTLELCFNEGGQLSGTTTAAGNNENYFLENGEGKFEYKGDTIHFGPGNIVGRKLTNLEGERYSTHFGNLRTSGTHVYITGITPFEHTLFFY